VLVAAQCKALPLVVELRSCALLTNQFHCKATNGPVLTENFLASVVCPAAVLIFDMASMAMMPLIARLVWLLTVKPSAEDLN
jgi:hypothetical protein